MFLNRRNFMKNCQSFVENHQNILKKYRRNFVKKRRHFREKSPKFREKSSRISVKLYIIWFHFCRFLSSILDVFKFREKSSEFRVKSWKFREKSSKYRGKSSKLRKKSAKFREQMVNNHLQIIWGDPLQKAEIKKSYFVKYWRSIQQPFETRLFLKK